MITQINNSSSDVLLEQNDSFSQVISNSSSVVLNNVDDSEFELPIDESAVFDFNSFLKSLKESEETLDIRQLMIKELKRQGISDPIAYLGRGGLDISMRLGKK